MELDEITPSAWRIFDGEGGYDYISYEGNESYKELYIERNGTKYESWVQPLYTIDDIKYFLDKLS